MPLLETTGGLCVPKTGYAFEYFGKNTPEGRENDSTSLLQFLLSNENTQGVRKLSDDIIGVPGKTRGVKIMAPQPTCFSVCPTEYNCLAIRTPYTPAMDVFEYNIDSRFTPCEAGLNEQSLKITASTFAQYCEIDNGEAFKEYMIKYDMRFVKELDKVFVNLLLQNITEAPKTFPILANNTTTGQRVINDELPLFISETIADAKMDIADYVIFGGQMVNMFKLKYGVGTTSAEGSVIANSPLPPLYYDRNFDTTFGKNSFVLIPKKAFQMVIWSQYVGSREALLEKEAYSTKMLPLGNNSFLPIDWLWKWDPECSSYEYQPSIFAELVKGIPGNCTDPDADGIFIIKDCNTAVLPVCPAIP